MESAPAIDISNILQTRRNGRFVAAAAIGLDIVRRSPSAAADFAMPFAVPATGEQPL